MCYAATAALKEGRSCLRRRSLREEGLSFGWLPRASRHSRGPGSAAMVGLLLLLPQRFAVVVNFFLSVLPFGLHYLVGSQVIE